MYRFSYMYCNVFIHVQYIYPLHVHVVATPSIHFMSMWLPHHLSTSCTCGCHTCLHELYCPYGSCDVGALLQEVVMSPEQDEFYRDVSLRHWCSTCIQTGTAPCTCMYTYVHECTAHTIEYQM